MRVWCEREGENRDGP